ncbi:hypothetical protein SI65_09101 [Aspergillus cristatus]|uniref:Uncharacterized protein n=1 Tax=Aspergillus cristatus TaxID=573508 RepID=A0A1E3B3N1_ASPCR|nr:hypothetical protein SI65_09101 [Aspergillus cristatus]
MENEVAVMTWLRKDTTVPVPEVVRARSRHDSDEIYDRLSQEQLEYVVDQIIDILEQLHRRLWDGVSGLTFAPGYGEVVPGRNLEETYW